MILREYAAIQQYQGFCIIVGRFLVKIVHGLNKKKTRLFLGDFAFFSVFNPVVIKHLYINKYKQACPKINVKITIISNVPGNKTAGYLISETIPFSTFASPPSN